MGNQLLGLTDPYGLRRREPVSLPEMSLEWGLDPVGTGLDAIDLADAVRQYSVGLGGDLPPETAFSDKPIRLPESLGGAAADLKAQQLANVTRLLTASGGEPAVGPTLRELQGKNQPQQDVPPEAGAAPALPQTMTLGSSSSTSSGIKVDPRQVAEGQAKIDAGAAGMQQAADDEGIAATNRIEDRNDSLAQAQADVEANAQQVDPAIAQARQDRDAYTAELQQAVADAKEEVNPDQWWGTRGMGQKIAIVAASMLGGFTEGFTWGKVKNRALDMIENAIDRDIRAQEQSINAARAKRGEMRGLVGILDSKLKDLELAKSAYRASVYEQLGRQFEVMSQNSRDLTVAKKSKVVASELQMRAGEAQKDFAVKTADHWQKTRGGHQVLVPQAKAAGFAPPDKKLRHDWLEQARSLTDASEKLAAHTQQSNDIGRWGAAKDRVVKKLTMGAVEGEGNVVEAARGEMAMGIVRAAAPGPVSNTDVALVAPRVVGPGMSKEAKIRSTTYAYGRMISGAVSQMQAAQRMGDLEAARELGIAVQAAKKHFAAALRSIK